jgi:hypothetical protein
MAAERRTRNDQEAHRVEEYGHGLTHATVVAD